EVLEARQSRRLGSWRTSKRMSLSLPLWSTRSRNQNEYSSAMDTFLFYTPSKIKRPSHFQTPLVRAGCHHSIFIDSSISSSSSSFFTPFFPFTFLGPLHFLIRCSIAFAVLPSPSLA